MDFVKFVRRYIIITVASFFYGVGIALFLDPNEIVPGGVAGIAMMVARFVPLQVGVLLFIFNIPILALGYYFFGREFIGSTIYATFAVSLFVDILEPMGAITNNVLLASIMGNILIAYALATIFKCGTTSGGIDIIIKILRMRHPHMQTGKFYLIVDVLIVGISVFVFGNVDLVFYAIIGIMVMSSVFDMVLYGKDEAALIYIISKEHNAVADAIYGKLKTGITFLRGKGGYHKKETEVVMCVVAKKNAPKIEEVVKEIDPRAFMIITSAKEIYGEGYKDFFANKI